ncbi:hypothetical protein O9H85_25340 [Paenibacillus filicis]|uniref:DUF4025 domain-containing protein n=1 Tax=Paenibacillus gyeongsangnamensis TaxID=3388067 RepID=A0ABT4QFL2_9BACL|nr:hypothetical protein [Paenibacillus filicis]MCZ8515674.1 hypothetical protein [Paenibacillus filicis]
MSEVTTSGTSAAQESAHEGRDTSFMDIDRMINEGLGGGNVTIHNGLIEESTTDTMDHPESVLDGGDTK